MRTKSNGVVIQISVAAAIVAAIGVGAVLYIASTPAATPPAAQPVAAKRGAASDTKSLIRAWMAENFADPQYEQVKWWVSKNGSRVALKLRSTAPSGGPSIGILGFDMKDGRAAESEWLEAMIAGWGPEKAISGEKKVSPGMEAMEAQVKKFESELKADANNGAANVDR